MLITLISSVFSSFTFIGFTLKFLQSFPYLFLYFFFCRLFFDNLTTSAASASLVITPTVIITTSIRISACSFTDTLTLTLTIVIRRSRLLFLFRLLKLRKIYFFSSKIRTIQFLIVGLNNVVTQFWSFFFGIIFLLLLLFLFNFSRLFSLNYWFSRLLFLSHRFFNLRFWLSLFHHWLFFDFFFFWSLFRFSGAIQVDFTYLLRPLKVGFCSNHLFLGFPILTLLFDFFFASLSYSFLLLLFLLSSFFRRNFFICIGLKLI